AHAALGDADHEIVKSVLARLDVDAVHVEERERDADRSPLIAIKEWMVTADPVQIRRCHLEDGLMHVSPAARSFAASPRRLQKSDVADSGRAAEKMDLLGMKAENFIERQEQRVHHSLSRLKSPAYLRLILSADLRNLRSREESRFGVITRI